MSRILFDIEADGLLPTVQNIWCICTVNVDTMERKSFSPSRINRGIEYLKSARTLIGHNIIGYDLPAIWKLTGEWESVPLIVDTLVISQGLLPERRRGHALAVWGEVLRFPKQDFSDYARYSPEMLEYCERDVEVNRRVLLALEEEADERFEGYLVY